MDQCHDMFARRCIAEHPASHVSWFLMSSCAYYCWHTSIISDDLFEQITKWLEANIDTIKHPHKHLISRDMFAMGSAFNLRLGDYPLRVQSAAMRLVMGYDNKEVA